MYSWWVYMPDALINLFPNYVKVGSKENNSNTRDWIHTVLFLPHILFSLSHLHNTIACFPYPSTWKMLTSLNDHTTVLLKTKCASQTFTDIFNASIHVLFCQTAHIYVWVLVLHHITWRMSGTVQKTSFPNGVVKILIYTKPAPCLANVGLTICSTSNSTITPRTKSLLASSSFFTPGRLYAPSISQIFTTRGRHALYQAQIAASSTAVKSLWAQLT